MNKALLQVDFFGEGKLYDVIHPTLGISSIGGIIDLPEIMPNGTYSGYFDFDVPIDNPFFFVTGFYYNSAGHFSSDLGGADTNFTQIGTRRWRLRFYGRVDTQTNPLPKRMIRFYSPFNPKILPAYYSFYAGVNCPPVDTGGAFKVQILWGEIRG